MRVFFRFYFLLVALLLTGAALTSRAQPTSAQFQWATSTQSPAPGRGYGAGVGRNTTDAAGNTYAWIAHWGPLTLGGVTYAADSTENLALVRYDAAGAVTWVRQFGPANARIDCRALTTDAAGNVYMAGRLFQTPVTFDSTTTLDPGNQIAAYLVKWSPTGTLLLARIVQTGGEAYPEALRVEPTTGDILLVGQFRISATLDTVHLRQPAGRQKLATYCARLSPAGVARWATAVVNTDTLSISLTFNIGLDRSGNAYFLGEYLYNCSFGGFIFPYAPPTRVGNTYILRRFWAKVSPVGRVIQVRTYDPGALPANGIGFDVAPDGFSYSINGLSAPATLAPGLNVQPTGRQDALLICYDPDGHIQWTRQFGGSTPADEAWGWNLTLRGDETLYATGQYRGALAGAGLLLPTTPTAPIAPYQMWVAALEQKSGRGLWGLSSSGSTTTAAYYLAPAANGVVLGLNTGSDSLRLGNLLVLTPGDRNGKAVITRIAERYNTLTGAAYLDANADGLQNATEGGFPGGLVVEVNPGAIPCAAPETTGRYDAYLDLGVNFTASLPNPPPHYTVVAQGPATTLFSTYGNVAAGRSFALQPIAGQQDIAVVLTLNSAARPGFPAVYDVQYRNVGTVTIAAGTLTLAPDARLAFRRSQPAATPGAGGLLTWAYANLLPGEMRRVRIEYVLANSAALNSILSSTAQVLPLTGDLVPADNAATETRVITGSFDPNDIQVNHIELSTTQVAAGEWLEYTIRFQNHGSDTAFTVLVHDSLSALHLRLSTMQLRAASHGCGWSISPTGQVLVRFTGIDLPPQSTNIFAADGFVRFRIRPVATLAVGDEIPNQAYIHFDYNAPFATNTALTRISTPTGFATDPAANAAQPHIWPNPTSGALHVEVPRETTGTLTLTLLDALGRAVRTEAVAVAAPGRTRAVLDVRGLPAGLYLLRGEGAGEGFARRVVVK